MKYTMKSRCLHWIMAALVVLAYILINIRGQFEKGTDLRALVVQGHFWAGIIVLLLVLPRLLERHRHTPPPITPPLQGALRLVATLTHYALYVFLLVQPVLGLLTVLLEKGSLPVPFIGIDIPSPFGTATGVAENMEDYHVLLGTLFYYVIGLHVVAALWHHFIRKDDTLKRMV